MLYQIFLKKFIDIIVEKRLAKVNEKERLYRAFFLFVRIRSMKAVDPNKKPRIYSMSFSSVYPLYIAKAEKKGRTKEEVDEIIYWLTGYDKKGFKNQLNKEVDLETFYVQAPRMNPSRNLIKGIICGVRVEDIKEPTMQSLRYLDKLIDELAAGKSMDKILRK